MDYLSNSTSIQPLICGRTDAADADAATFPVSLLTQQARNP